MIESNDEEIKQKVYEALRIIVHDLYGIDLEPKFTKPKPPADLTSVVAFQVGKILNRPAVQVAEEIADIFNRAFKPRMDEIDSTFVN